MRPEWIKSSSRDCLIIPERPHCGLPREVRTEPEASFRRLWWRQSQAFTGPLTIYQTVSPRTPVNKGIKRAGAATPRPSTTPFLALLHAEGFRHLRREVGVVVHYLPCVRFATVDVCHTPIDALAMLGAQ